MSASARLGPVRGIVVALAAWALAVPVGADELKVPLKGRDGLVMELPAGWAGTIQSPGPGLPPTIVVSGGDRRAFQLMITPIAPRGEAKATSSAEIRGMVRAAADKALERAEEKEIELRELQAAGKAGWYYAATDRRPEAGGYKLLTQGAMAFDELRITFSLLLNGDAQDTTAKALEVLRTLRRLPEGAATGGAPDYAIALPGGVLPRVVVPGANWTVSQVRSRPDGSGVYHLIFDDRRELNFSIYIERKARCRSAAECLESSLANPAYKATRDLRRFDAGGFKAAAFLIDGPAGMGFTQGHVLASTFLDEQWLDVHISKVGPAQMDLSPLIDLLGSIVLK